MKLNLLKFSNGVHLTASIDFVSKQNFSFYVNVLRLSLRNIEFAWSLHPVSLRLSSSLPFSWSFIPDSLRARVNSWSA